jgi:hypothetical protein
MKIQIKPIEEVIALELILNNHYSKIMPRLTKHHLGGYVNDELVGVLTLGWGTRPVHTIKKLFPSLNPADYYEIGKMCILEKMPKNTESQFLAAIESWIKKNEPQIKVLFTWADGILGKPGYVYQSANFLYGGFITTDLYITDKGEKVHPRTSQGLSDKGDKICGHRPNKEMLLKNGWNHYRGRQFRYVRFLCNKIEKRKLLTESLVLWNTEYPKEKDLKWQVQDLSNGEWKDVDRILYNSSVTTQANKTAIKNKLRVKSIELSRSFFNF